MKAFFDTSVLIAVFYGDHPHHSASLDALTSYPKREASCAAHTLVEVYSALTRMPGKHRLGSDQAMLFICALRERLTLVALTTEEYDESLRTFAELGVVGGAIYDALLASCALKFGAEILYTWNLRHFKLLGPRIAALLRTPR